MNIKRILGSVAVVLISLASFIGGYWFGVADTLRRETIRDMRSANSISPADTTQ